MVQDIRDLAAPGLDQCHLWEPILEIAQKFVKLDSLGSCLLCGKACRTASAVLPDP